MDDLTAHARLNRAAWDRLAGEYREPGRRAWAQADPSWGIWRVPERESRILPEVAGRDVVELGCGTAYWSAWLARRGARVIGLDNSARQLETARACQREHGLEFPLLHGSAEAVPLRDACADLALSEYGASIWCDPYLWDTGSRPARASGWPSLIFLKHGASTLMTVCGPDGDQPVGGQLARDDFGLHRLEWNTDGSVEFDLPHGAWDRPAAPLPASPSRGLVEVQAPPDAHLPLHLRAPGVGAPLAQRGDLDRRQAPVTVPQPAAAPSADLSPALLARSQLRRTPWRSR